MSNGVRDYCVEALATAGIKPDDDESIPALAELRELAYEKCRVEEAKKLGITVKALDKIVRQHRAQSQQEQATLPHWKVEPWPNDILGGDLLDDIKAVFERYIVLPAGAAETLSLWTLHAWTMDAGDCSPFLVLSLADQTLRQDQCADSYST